MAKRILFLLLCGTALFAQIKFPQVEKTAGNITKGLIDSYSWYDIPVAGAYFYRNIVNPRNIGDKIIFAPMGIEQSLASRYGHDDNNSLGSIDKNIIPNYIIYTRLAANVSLNLFTDADITSQSYQKIFLFKKSLLYTYVLTEYVKNLIKRTRPDGTDNRSFFSGHTSTTFAAATFLYKELHDAYEEWEVTKNNKVVGTLLESISFGTLYGWAGYVGYSRIRDKKHYISDVVVGAAVGTAISYFLYEHYFGEDDCFLSNISVTALDKVLAISFKLDIH